MYSLPNDLIIYIYKFDNTYYHYYNNCMNELINLYNFHNFLSSGGGC